MHSSFSGKFGTFVLLKRFFNFLQTACQKPRTPDWVESNSTPCLSDHPKPANGYHLKTGQRE